MSRLVLLDNTVLSNFAIVQRPDLVLTLWGSRCAITRPVWSEHMQGVKQGIEPSFWKSVRQIDLKPNEVDWQDQLPPRLGIGERSCLAVAFHRNGLVVTDDRDARKDAKRLDIPVTGTLGVLVAQIKLKRLLLPDANELLQQMVAHGYHSPVDVLDPLLSTI